MDTTFLKYSFVGYLRKNLKPNVRARLKEAYNKILNDSSSVVEWNYYPRKRRYEVTIHQEFPCFNYDTYIIEAVVELLQQLIETDLFRRNLVLVDGIFQNHLNVEYKLALDELRNFIKIIDGFYSKPHFLIMDSTREEILNKYECFDTDKTLYDTLLLNPNALFPYVKKFTKSARRWGWYYFIKYFNRNEDFGLETEINGGKLVYIDKASTTDSIIKTNLKFN